uniref:Uncharacterized protein n=1 Tax=Rhizophora mucronata TaxID=61149 RepID=A0A2P2PN72_RHIMU
MNFWCCIGYFFSLNVHWFYA